MTSQLYLLNELGSTELYFWVIFLICIESLREKFCLKRFEGFFSSFYFTFAYKSVIHLKTESAASSCDCLLNNFVVSSVLT